MEVKVVLLGVSSVGKTSLFNRFINDTFQGPKATVPGPDCCGKRRVGCGGDSEITINLWDTAGSQKFTAFTPMYYTGSSAAIICFDLTEYTTLLPATFWVSDLTRKLPRAALFLCGCKWDLLQAATSSGASSGRCVDEETVRTFVIQNSIPEQRFFRVSAKTGDNVAQLFEAVALSCGQQLRGSLAGSIHSSVEASSQHPIVIRSSESPSQQPGSKLGNCCDCL